MADIILYYHRYTAVSFLASSEKYFNKIIFNLKFRIYYNNVLLEINKSGVKGVGVGNLIKLILCYILFPRRDTG